MRSEIESGVTLGDVGPVLELTYPNGKRGRVRLRSVDDAAMLKMLLPLITDVLDPAELAGRMLTSAFAAPTDKGEPMVDQLEQYIEDGAAFEIQQQAAISAAAAVPAVKGHEVAAPSMYREYTEDERRASLAAQKRQHSLFLSPKRRAEARAAAARDRAFSLELMSLRIERDQKAKEAAAAASAACIAEFDQRMARMKLAFDAGKPNWREIR